MNANPFESLKQWEASDCTACRCPSGQIHELVQYARDHMGFNMLIDVTAVDNGEDASPRFTVVYHLLNMSTASYLRIYSDCEVDASPEIPSISDLYAAANWHERETYDMFGIRFAGHPDLRRILMWEGYPYHPLRKEFPLAGIEVEYPEADIVEKTGLKVKPAPMVGGPFVSCKSGAMSVNEPRALDQSWNESQGKLED